MIAPEEIFFLSSGRAALSLLEKRIGEDLARSSGLVALLDSLDAVIVALEPDPERYDLFAATPWDNP